MNDFDTLEKCIELFRSINFIGNENNIFYASNDTSKHSGMVNGMDYPYDALLINLTDTGIGMIMLKQPGIPFTYKMEKMEVQRDKYLVYPNENILSVEIKNATLFKSYIKRVTISTNDNKKHILLVNVMENKLPYHNNGFLKFIEKYSKK